MGDRVAVLNEGVVQQCATPREMYARPANLFVAGFLGSPSMNLVELPVIAGGVRFGDITIPVNRQTLSSANSRHVTVGVRPEDLQIVDVGLEFEVDVVEDLGSDAYGYGRANINESQDGSPQTLVVRVDWRHPPLKGDRVHLAPIGGHAIHVFDTESGARLS